MSTALQSLTGLPDGPVRRFTVDEYHRLIEVGVLGEDEPVELIEGFIVPKMPNNPSHAVSVQWIADLLRDLQAQGWCVRMQLPVTLDESEPEPDIVIARGHTRDFRKRHPEPSDIGLVVELSSTSLQYDRKRKAAMYARAGLQVYWVVNVDAGSVEVFTSPDPSAAEPMYRTNKSYSGADRVPLVLAGQSLAEIAVSDLLG